MTISRVPAVLAIVWFALSGVIDAQKNLPDSPDYLVPPQEIVDIIDAPPTPTAIISPDGKTVAFLERRSAPPIQWLARPMHRLAGYRIDPRNSGPWSAPTIQAIDISTDSRKQRHAVCIKSKNQNSCASWNQFRMAEILTRRNAPFLRRNS